MEMINMFCKNARLNRLSRIMVIVFFSSFLFVSQCEKKPGELCDSCESDTDCISGLACKTFQYQNSSITSKRCADANPPAGAQQVCW